MTYWNKRFMELADLVATWSKDPSTKVGCVLVNEDRHVISTGFNGFPRGVQDHTYRYTNRDVKYLMVQHAEMNAVTQAVAPTKGSTAYVTHHPCATCMGLLINAGVKVIYTRKPAEGLAERFKTSFQVAQVMADEARVALLFLEDD